MVDGLMKEPREERPLVVERMDRLRWIEEERRRDQRWKTVSRKRTTRVAESRRRWSEGTDELKSRLKRRRKQERSSQVRLEERPSRSGNNIGVDQDHIASEYTPRRTHFFVPASVLGGGGCECKAQDGSDGFEACFTRSNGHASLLGEVSEPRKKKTG